MALTERYVTTTGTDTYANSTNIATPMSLATALTNAAAGDRINMKAGTYTRTADDTPTNAGTVAAGPIIWRGYNTAITDGYLGRTNGNGALITTNYAILSYDSTHEWTMKAFNIMENISFVAVSSTTNGFLPAADCALINCKFSNTSTANSAIGIAAAGLSRVLILNCDVSVTGNGTGNQCISTTSAAMIKIIGCRLTCSGTNGVGITFTTGTGVIANNTIYGCGSHGIASTGTTPNMLILNNTIVGNVGAGINILTGSSTLACIIGNMITDNTGDGIDMVSVDNAAIVGYNRYRDNANSINHAGEFIDGTKYGDVDSGTTGTTATDYTNYGAGDYSLIASSPATSVGLPLYASIGALQRSQTAVATSAGVFLF